MFIVLTSTGEVNSRQKKHGIFLHCSRLIIIPTLYAAKKHFDGDSGILVVIFQVPGIHRLFIYIFILINVQI